MAAKSASIEEIWVVSCPDVEPINLAAAVKRDNPRRRVSDALFAAVRLAS